MKRTLPISKQERESQIKRLCDESVYSFCRWESEYSDRNSKMIMNCEIHGEWRTSVQQFVNKHTRCPTCARGRLGVSRRVDEKERIKLVESRGYKFLGWANEYTGVECRIKIECKTHGAWEVRLASFISGRGCPGCNKTGFNRSKDNYVYCLRSDDGVFAKVGISNTPERRIYELKLVTPFDFSPTEVVKVKDAMKTEKYFHKKYKSANMRGFGGATEWLLWDAEIIEDFRKLSGN